MPNGAAITLVRPQPADHAPIKTAQPAAANGTAIALPSPLRAGDRERIGNLVADAATLVCTGMMDGMAEGRLRPSTRARACDVFVRMYELQEEVGRHGIDFAAVARVEGARVLIARLHAADGLAPDEAALEEILSWPLSILAEVTTKELEYQRINAH
jgi:hypothetical protein